jgi:MoxR-like ATPase
MQTLDELTAGLDGLVSRADILAHTRGLGLNDSDVIQYLNTHFSHIIVKKNPIVFDFSLRNTAIPVAKQEVEAAEEKDDLTLLAESLIHEMDATRDPAISQMIRVESYRRIDEYIGVKDDYPLNIYVYGESGGGKTTSILASAKKAGKPVVRVNFSYATDIDDVFGGIRLKNDTTSFEIGPAIVAALTGATLLLDEVDTANPKVLSELYNMLERRAFFVKKLNRMIVPKKGFSIVGTGNTKGDGCGSDRYVGVNVLSKAFRERFSVFIHYDMPNANEMEKIIFKQFPAAPQPIVAAIAKWHAKILDSVKGGVMIEAIGTRRLLDLTDIALRKGAKEPTDKAMMSALEDVTSIYDDEVSSGLQSLWDSMFGG